MNVLDWTETYLKELEDLKTGTSKEQIFLKWKPYLDKFDNLTEDSKKVFSLYCEIHLKYEKINEYISNKESGFYDLNFLKVKMS